MDQWKAARECVGKKRGRLQGVGIDPESLMKSYEKCPVKVVPDIIEVEGLSILAFKIV